MKAFTYYKVNSVPKATALLAKYQEKAAILAGGSDLFGLMKDRPEGKKFKMPEHVIDIKEIKGLNEIKAGKTGLRIGATATVSEIAASPAVAEGWPLLAQAASLVAVPQIRNVGTLAGNLCQRPRCWYFRRSLFDDCLRKGGGTCYAAGGENQYHAIMGGKGCYMVYPSDLAPALIALNAKIEIAGGKGTRTIPIEQFYLGPGKNIRRENALGPGEMVVGVDVPKLPAGNKGAYIKYKERQSFDFALVSVAVSLTTKGSTVADSRVVFGGIAPFPFRNLKAEAALKGKDIGSATAEACRAAVLGAEPLKNNGYKVDAARGVLEEALGRLA